MNAAPKDEQSVQRRLASALGVLNSVLDIVDQPVDSPEPPEWCRQRSWQTFLLGLDDRVLEAGEQGLWSVVCASSDVPEELRHLVFEVERATALPRLSGPGMPLPRASLRGVSSRKREQLSTLLGVISKMASSAARIVDIGSGSGHLSRLAAEIFRCETLAVDRDAGRAEVGSLRARRRARDVGGLALEFSIADVLLEAPAFRGTDLAVGLHACGELGDELVKLSSEAACDLALVSCCLQKIRALSRVSLSNAAAGLTLRRGALGLTNLTLRAEGVETSLAEVLRARQTRYALRQLLLARGLELAAGEEMHGVNRRRALNGLSELACHVLSLRGLQAASATEILRFERAAARDYAALRRLSLPRNLLGRLVELTAVLDRGAALEERGHAVLVATLFDGRVTPRNIALFATRDRERLPALELAVRSA